MTAPQDPNSPATVAADAAATAGRVDSDDQVFDGELVEDGSGTLAAGDDSDDPEEISDAELSNDDPTGTLAAADKAADKPADTADESTAATGTTSESPSADSGATTGATQTDAAAPGAGEDTPAADVPAGTDSPTLTPAIPLGGFAFPTTHAPAFDYTDAGIPTLSYVQDKIEKRLGTAQGSTELNESSSAGKQAADQQTERERLAKAKLDEIRKSIEGH